MMADSIRCSSAQVVGEGAAKTPGKRSLAMEAFATALRSIPATICDNAGTALMPSWPPDSHCISLSSPPAHAHLPS